MRSFSILGAQDKRIGSGIGLALAGLVAVAVLPLLVFGGGVAWMVVDQKKSAVAEELASTARALRVAVDRQLISQFAAAEVLASDLSLDDNDLAAFSQRARRTVAANRQWLNVALIDPRSYRIIAGSLPIPSSPMTSLAPRSVDAVAQTHKPQVVGVLPSGRISPGPRVLLLYPVMRGNEVRHVLAIAMNTQSLSDVFVEQQLAATWTGAVIDANMLLAGRSRDPERYVGMHATPTLTDHVAASTSGMFTALNQEGATVYTVFSRSPLTGWSVAIGVPAAEVEGPMRRMLLQLLAAGGTLIAFALILTGLVGRGIVRRRHAYEEALQESQLRLEESLQEFSDLVARIPVGVYKFRMRKDGGQCFDFVSARWCEQVGVTADEVYADAGVAFKRVHPDDLPEFIRLHDTMRSALRPFVWEGRLVGAEGVFWLHVESSATQLANGDILWNGMQYDITERKRADEALQESESKYRSLFETANDGIFLQDANCFLDCNEKGASMYGLPREGVIGKSPADFCPARQPDGRLSSEVAAGHITAALRGETPCFEWQPMRADGTPFDVEITLSRVDYSGRPCLQAIVRDITERRRAEASLRLSASVFANSYEGIVIADSNNVIVDANPAFTRITGYTREEIIGQSPRLLASGRHGSEFFAGMWTALREHDFWRGEIWNRRKNGEVFPEMLSISVVRDNAGNLQRYIGVFSDISQIKAHEAELHRIAYYDTLTGVPNRRLLADRLGQATARARRSGKPMAICYLDLDGFKPVNDQYGHDAGDRLLIAITDRLKSILRAEDTLARLGGDEFVLLFTDLAQLEESHVVLDRLLAAVSAPVMIEGSPISVSASVGVTLYPADDVDADTLLRHADQAMYLAKEAGKNRYHLFDPDHDRQVQSYRYHLQRLRAALENSEFVLHYQPKVDLISGAVIGAEALIRWQHPEKGLLLPAEFLHYLNGSELEIAVGEWVITSALEQILAWSRAGLSIVVSVNVSADHLLHVDFAERLRLLLERHPDVAPANLELEILESAALSDMEQAVHTLTSCRQLGVSFALDDFGTGYSSLTYFRNLPVQTLKIDQSFVREMLEDPDDLNIVESVVRLAQAFNRPLIAEGVETLEHAATLIQLGCRLAQGYGIARPMPPEQLPAWVEQWRNKADWLSLDGSLAAREDLALSVAGQSHRNWIDRIVEHIEHPKDDAAADLDSGHCRFGRWYRNNGSARYGALPEFQAIAPLHERVHGLARELLALSRDGHGDAARQRLPELYATRDSLLQLLGAAIEKTANSSP